ncbi:MAG: substrate-binding domain-containing protein [Saprospiraceae bacterium]|nr:substrate-binding domain-containing protein [Saprospiraceae bacterium]
MEDTQFTIGFSQCTMGDGWRKTMHDEMERELTFHPDIRLIVKDAENSNERQIAQIRELIEVGVDLLIVSPNEADPITPVVEEVYRKDIPVLLIDRKTSSDEYTAYIGADNREIGITAGKYVALFLKGKGKIVELWGLRGSSPAIERHEGFVTAISEFPGLEVTAELDGRWEAPFVRDALTKELHSNPDIDLIYAHNDRMAAAANEVLEEFGLEVKVAIVGVDGLAGEEGGMGLVQRGILEATILYPTGGDVAIRIASDILHRHPFNKENVLQTTVIDDRNVRIMELQIDRIQEQASSIQRQVSKLSDFTQTFRNQRNLLFTLAAFSLLMIAMVALIFYQLLSKQIINKQLEEQNEEISRQRNEIANFAQQAEKANQDRLQFFTNISHEFKTPITLMLGPLQELLHDKGKLKADHQEELKLMERNTKRLLRLVEQLMDFRRIDNEMMNLQVEEVDLVSFIKNIMSAFNRVAISRSIDFKFTSHLHRQPVWIDRNLLDKVFFNLLSNAFKFVKDSGYIHVSLSQSSEGRAVVKVSDNGRGMSKEHAAHAFDRFYQGEHYSSIGTGLGLSLSKEIVDLHGGQIELETEKGVGTTFTIRLRLDNDHFNTEQIRIGSQERSEHEEVDLLLDDLQFENDTDHVLQGIDGAEGTDYQILIIEDNEELGQYMRNKLVSQYHVSLSKLGKQGIEFAESKIPDLIICDLMLPDLAGEKVIRHLKNNVITSHIPVIILSAKSQESDLILGFASMADDYVTKPFNMEILRSKIASLFKNRELIRQYYSSEIVFDINRNKSQRSDLEFLDRFKQCLVNGFKDHSFQINDVCKEMHLSRVQLYRKIKALTGVSVNEHLQNLRLSKARELLTDSQLSISEIAYQSGFGSPSYFSTIFKSQFELSPSEFRRS